MADFMEISIIDTAARCGIKFIDYGKAEMSVNCPFCNDRKRRMYLNAANNLFYCHNCNESGNSITFYAKLTGLDNKQAYKELADGGIIRSQSITHKQISDTARVPLPLSERHAVYLGLLQSLELSARHRDNLFLNRGLDDDVIERNLYRTVPSIATASEISKELTSRFPLAGVPGFYTKGRDWKMSLHKGFFIPVRSEDGLIQGLQIRLDDAKNRKYRWFSSNNRENGTPAHAWIHSANSGGDAVFITEGALKADVAAHLTGDCFIGLSGVNCISRLIPLLNNMGITKVYEALDMDKRTNQNVAISADKLHHRLAEVGIDCTPCTWDSVYKGIDDFLLSNII